MGSVRHETRRNCIDLVYRYSKVPDGEIKWAFTRVHGGAGVPAFAAHLDAVIVAPHPGKVRAGDTRPQRTL